MSNDDRKEHCLRWFQRMREKGKSMMSGFEESLTILKDEVARNGLEENDLILIVDIITNVELGSLKCASLIKCLIPRHKMPGEATKAMVSWYLATIDAMPVTVAIIMLQWIIGLLDHQLIEKRIIGIYYDVFFYLLLKRDKLETHLARLIYGLTRPEDITRRQVSRLLKLHQRYSKPQKHIIALLSLFKSYKPEMVPEKVPTMNIESVWRPIPEVLRLGFEDARDRNEVRSIQHSWQKSLEWNIAPASKSRKRAEPLIPTVGYFHVGSSIYREKDAKSIFDLTSLAELGKHHLSVELPCNATSLLVNVAGHHLLAFADYEYQSRFSYNLYNTLRKAFIFEEGRYSKEEKNDLLDRTAQFSRYIGQGIPAVNRFLDEYILHSSTEKERLKLLALLQWLSLESFADLRDNVLLHVESMFYESSLDVKCYIITIFRKLITNQFANQSYQERDGNRPALFLGEKPTTDLVITIPLLTKFVRDLIIIGLNIHSYNTLLMSEALTFYEEVCRLETLSNLPLWTVAPPAVIYGGLVTKSCAILSRVCTLLLRYHDLNAKLREQQTRNLFEKEVHSLNIYGQDLARALWFNEPVKARASGYFLKTLPNNVVNDLVDCNLDSMLNINNHYAILPYKYSMLAMGLEIRSTEDALNVADHYYSSISEFCKMFAD